jgi:ATP-dependent protease ClpP protease subunit
MQSMYTARCGVSLTACSVLYVSQEEVTRALDRDNFMSAQQALEFGLIDSIIELKKE